MIKLNNFKIGYSERLTIFGGVNVIESKELSFEVADEFLLKITRVLYGIKVFLWPPGSPGLANSYIQIARFHNKSLFYGLRGFQGRPI